MKRKIIVTGGAGFIGSNLIRLILQETEHEVLNLDKLTYAGNVSSPTELDSDSRYEFEQLDIVDGRALSAAFERFQPDCIIHLAAESHVDRSISGPGDFVRTNIVGTYELLQSARSFWSRLDCSKQAFFRFLHISTDEVFGSLSHGDGKFSESSPYQPNSPYSASKASADHLVRAWNVTYGLPTLAVNCSNNYGPFQHTEKLIPTVISNAFKGLPIPVYGNGENIRDWIFVRDHAKAIVSVLSCGTVGETYNVGGNNELSNIELVRSLCAILDKQLPIADNLELTDAQRANLNSYADLIEFVGDRPGHDFRYAVDSTKICNDLEWSPTVSLQTGLEQTVHWYLENRDRWIVSGYRKTDPPIIGKPVAEQFARQDNSASP